MPRRAGEHSLTSDLNYHVSSFGGDPRCPLMGAGACGLLLGAGACGL